VGLGLLAVLEERDGVVVAEEHLTASASELGDDGAGARAAVDLERDGRRW
jgi:hypothetical protein